MSAVELRQHRSEAVGPGSNLCRVRYFHNFSDIYDFTEQNLILFFFPPLNHKMLSYQKFSETLKSSPTKYFVSERKKVSKEYRDTNPPLSYPYIFFHRKKLVKHRKDPLRSFTVLWDRKFSTKPWSPPLVCMKTFRVRSYWSTEAFIYKFFGNVRQWIFNGEKWYTLLMRKRFDTRVFRNIEWLNHEIFRRSETKDFGQKIVISPSDWKNFSIPESFWCIELFPNKFFLFCETNKFEPKVVIPLFRVK